MTRLLKKSFSVMLAAVMLTVMCLPSTVLAGDKYYDNYYGGSYGSNFGKGTQTAGGELGRSLGGATGMAIGAIGGAALASAVVKAAGIAAMGPLATVLTISAITAGSLFLGSKVFSTLGQSLERSMGAKNLWTMVGAALGAVAAVALLGSTGIFAGGAGLIFKALIGGIAGGTLCRLLSGVLETVATPRILYAATGGIIAAVGGMGFAGAIGGIAFGYLLGSIMDSVYFADRNRTTSSYIQEGTYKAETLMDKLKNSVSRIKNWVAGKTGGIKNTIQNNWDDDYSNQYYGNYYNTGYNTGYNYGNDNYGQANYTVNYQGSYGTQGYTNGYNDYRSAYTDFINLNNDPNASVEMRRDALERVRQSNMNMNNNFPSSYGSFNYGY